MVVLRPVMLGIRFCHSGTCRSLPIMTGTCLCVLAFLLEFKVTEEECILSDDVCYNSMRSIAVFEKFLIACCSSQNGIFSLQKVGSIKDITNCKHLRICFILRVPGRVPRNPIFQTNPAKKSLFWRFFKPRSSNK